VPGTDLELTHWTDNKTPLDLYADTSTEIALNFAEARLTSEKYNDLDNAIILNNHFDTDGVLSVWACLEPKRALEYKSLLIDGAEAGDFSEWSSDIGVKLDCAISSFLMDEDEEGAYHRALDKVSSLLSDFEATGGSSFEELWKRGWEDAVSGCQSLVNGLASITKGTGRIALVKEQRNGVSRLSPYALHAGLKKLGLGAGQPNAATRILRATCNDNSGWKYEYEKPGHGWVKQLVRREVVPDVDSKELVQRLNDRFKKSTWTVGGCSGLINICKTKDFIDKSPETVMQTLLELDNGAK